MNRRKYLLELADGAASHRATSLRKFGTSEDGGMAAYNDFTNQHLDLTIQDTLLYNI